MTKILKNTIKKFPRLNSLKIYKLDNSKKYYCNFYVGTHQTKSGNVQKSLKTENVKVAEQKAKQIYEEWFLNHKDEVRLDKRVFKEDTFTSQIAVPYFKFKIRKYQNHTQQGRENTGKREEQKYKNFMFKYFENLNYRSNEELTSAIEIMVDDFRQNQMTDSNIQHYTQVLSNMFNYAIKNNVIRSKPDFPKLTPISKMRPSYTNDELNLINKKFFEYYEITKEKFYLEVKDFINLIRSAGFRPGLEPLKIKKFQFRHITDKENPNEPILAFTIFGTKTKPKHQLTCHPYFAKYIFPEILNRNPNTTPEDYLLFPEWKDRQKLYNKIYKLFTKTSKKLNLYYRQGTTRPIYSIRHTFIKNRYNENPQSVEIIARQSNTSPRMIHKNYLDEDDIMMIEEYRKLYPKKKKLRVIED